MNDENRAKQALMDLSRKQIDGIRFQPLSQESSG